MLELIKREVHNTSSRTLHLLVLRKFANLIMMSAIKRVPKFFLEHLFANSFVALILSPYYLNVNFL